jgi:hypothetical protein
MVHNDEGSVYTLILVMSKPDEFEGGQFFIQKNKSNSDKVNVDEVSISSDLNSPPDIVIPTSIDELENEFIGVFPPYLGGIIINSTSNHGVTEITSGHRVIYALEFWLPCSSSIWDRRPSVDSIAACNPIR